MLLSRVNFLFTWYIIFIAKFVLLNNVLISYSCLTLIGKYPSYVGILLGFRKNLSSEKHVIGHITLGNIELRSYKYVLLFPRLYSQYDGQVR